MEKIEVTVDVVGTQARFALEECDGDKKKAVELLLLWATEDEQRKPLLSEPMMEYAAKKAICEAMRYFRKNAWRRKPESLKQNPDAAATGRLSIIKKGLLDSYLPTGVLFRDATRFDLSNAIELYDAHALGNKARADFLRKVSQRLRNDKITVGDVLDEQQVLEIKEQAARPRSR